MTSVCEEHLWHSPFKDRPLLHRALLVNRLLWASFHMNNQTLFGTLRFQIFTQPSHTSLLVHPSSISWALLIEKEQVVVALHARPSSSLGLLLNLMDAILRRTELYKKLVKEHHCQLLPSHQYTLTVALFISDRICPVARSLKIWYPTNCQSKSECYSHSSFSNPILF